MIFHFFPPSIPKEVFLYSRSRSVSLRGMNVSSSENKNSSSQDERYMAIQQMLDHVNNFGTFCFSFFASLFFCSTERQYLILALQKMKLLFLPVLLLMEPYQFVRCLLFAEFCISYLVMRLE